MKYQEQVNGVTRQMMSQAPQKVIRMLNNPAVIEQVMIKAAHSKLCKLIKLQHKQGPFT
jgi:hypothetical protein